MLPGAGLPGAFCPPPGPWLPVPGFTGLVPWLLPLGDGTGDGLTASVGPVGLPAPPGPVCVLFCVPGESDVLREVSVSARVGRVLGRCSFALVVEVGPGLAALVPGDGSVR